jgi:hypothetical protein
MPRHALPCIVCAKPLINVDQGADNQPYGGTEFTTLGHYGSTIHDSFVAESDEPQMQLVVNICDTCILRAIDQGVIQSRGIKGIPLLANHVVTPESRAWVLAQNEKQYGSAYGDDQPVDYREQMLKAGWSKEKLDAEEAEYELIKRDARRWTNP